MKRRHYSFVMNTRRGQREVHVECIGPPDKDGMVSIGGNARIHEGQLIEALEEQGQDDYRDPQA